VVMVCYDDDDDEMMMMMTMTMTKLRPRRGLLVFEFFSRKISDVIKIFNYSLSFYQLLVEIGCAFLRMLQCRIVASDLCC
jgi:hypothetical protein